MEKKYRVFRFLFLFFFVTFLTLYFSSMTGYYEYQNHEKMALTEEQIRQFEEDVKAGLEVDVKDYLENTSKDYQNGFSKAGFQLSNGISTFIKKGVIKVFGTISTFVTN